MTQLKNPWSEVPSSTRTASGSSPFSALEHSVSDFPVSQALSHTCWGKRGLNPWRESAPQQPKIAPLWFPSKMKSTSQCLQRPENWEWIMCLCNGFCLWFWLEHWFGTISYLGVRLWWPDELAEKIILIISLFTLGQLWFKAQLCLLIHDGPDSGRK